jgi:hypothetical protein
VKDEKYSKGNSILPRGFSASKFILKKRLTDVRNYKRFTDGADIKNCSLNGYKYKTKQVRIHKITNTAFFLRNGRNRKTYYFM